MFSPGNKRWLSEMEPQIGLPDFARDRKKRCLLLSHNASGSDKSTTFHYKPVSSCIDQLAQPGRD